MQELLLQGDVSTTMTHTHVLNRGPAAVRSPADRTFGPAPPARGPGSYPHRDTSAPSQPISTRAFGPYDHKQRGRNADVPHRRVGSKSRYAAGGRRGCHIAQTGLSSGRILVRQPSGAATE